MRFKEGVSYSIPGIVKIFMAAEKIYTQRGIECTITSLMDGTHSPNSKHYSGCAADLRIWSIPTKDEQIQVVKELQRELGWDYDVVLEPNHIHVEYDPDE